MANDTGIDTPWTDLRPSLSSAASGKAFIDLAHSLTGARKHKAPEEAIGVVRAAFIKDLTSCRRSDCQALLGAGLVLCDLAVQGWQLRVRGGKVAVRAPFQISDNRAAEKV